MEISSLKSKKASSENFLEIQNITFAYAQKIILNNCSMNIEQGKISAFLGKNGSGKSTLIKIINGLLNTKQGEIIFQKQNIRSLSAQENAKIIGYVPQSYEGFFNFPVLDMVVMGRNPYKSFFERPNKQDYVFAEEALSLIDIEHLKDRFFQELSGGEKQLVLIARAIAQQPYFLLLDEPTSHLDFYYQHKVMEALVYLTEKQNMGILIAMHDPNLCARYAKHVFLLKNGELYANGEMNELFQSEILSYIYDLPIQVSTVGKYLHVYSQ